MNSTQMSDAMLWQCLSEAEQRKSDQSLSIDARIRSLQSYTMLLRAASNRGHSYTSLKAAATGGNA